MCGRLFSNEFTLLSDEMINCRYENHEDFLRKDLSFIQNPSFSYEKVSISPKNRRVDLLTVPFCRFLLSIPRFVVVRQLIQATLCFASRQLMRAEEYSVSSGN